MAAIVPSSFGPTRGSSGTFTPSRLIAQPPKVPENGQGEKFKMAAATSALVDYGSTSEEDNFSDSEWREGPELLALPPASASLGMSRWSSDASLSPDCPTNGWEQSDSPLHQSARAPDHPSPESLTVNSSSEGEAEGDGEATQQFSACRQGQQSEDDHTQSPTDAADSSSDSDNSNGRRPRWPLPMHSSTEEQKPASKRPRLQTSRRGAQGRGAYALKLHQLTAEMRELLARSRAFFTKPHSLQRPGGPVGMSTYSKAEERILCKSPRGLSLHACRRRHVQAAAPEV